MPSDVQWETTTLGEMTAWSSGGTPSKGNAAYWGGDIPWISASSMKTLRLCESGLKITELGLENGSRLASQSSILLLVRGSELHKRIPVGIATRPVAFNQDVKALKASPALLPEYLLYWILGNEQLLLSKVEETGIGAGKLDTDVLKKLSLLLPPLAVQREIVSTLGCLDDKIQLLREANATLEAIAQTLFKSWFVDFDPVQAKSEGREPEGMTPEVAALFPSEFEEVEGKRIPKGWEVKSLDGIAEFLNGLALQKFPAVEGKPWLPVIKIAQLRQGSSDGADKASADIKPAYIVHDGDVLFSWSGSLEVAIWCGGRGALNQHLFKVSSADYPKWFYYQWNRHHLSSFRAIASEKAVTMGHIKRHHLTDAKVIVPPRKVLKEASAIFAPLLDQAVDHNLRIRTLATLRDTLLPELLSGSLRIPAKGAV